MSRTCQVTGRTPRFGHHLLHSHRRTRRRFDVNAQTRSYWVPSLGRRVRLTLSARGIESVVADLRARGKRL